ncbi:E3 ubiquitin-protein ligase XIAP isoform X2 [Acyrthosiphon pisum]|uniref:RING-type domain-containing protein n=1 Tax=Acyrthosiphon pisum TaxID=7029 RepID=A0A8R2D5K0_ACYPI|nr:E3 ubiquitin-protein ligase XIAP isoform X2 [Acyrthosiphon pisum]|eukprot:XP_016661893.1 PREDICTED: E3 ubiquitin-protein ligase XIAP isoform X2 [Acyrthosiphon pisum]
MTPNLLNIFALLHMRLCTNIYIQLLRNSLEKPNTTNTVTVYRAVYTTYSSIQLLRALRRWMTPSPNHKPVSPTTLANILKFEKNIIHMSNGCPIILNTSYPITESVSDNPVQHISRPMSYEETPSWDLTTYENRLRTFYGVWKLNFITPDQMAKAGLYYLGIQDRVRCLYCSTEFDYWQQGDDPVIEHKRQSPQCPFFNDSSAGYDVCGIYGSAPDIHNHESKKVQDFLDSVGILYQINPPKHRDFATLEARLKSFEKCLIPLKQNIQTLCEAGFFYIGNGTNDQMLCYYCSQGLKDWEENDEPWTEHAKWAHNCSFVLLNKGKHFVDKARGVKSTKFNPTELFKLIAEHKDMSITENNMKVNSTKRLDQLDQISNQQCKSRDPSTVPDSMLCKICYKEEMKVAFIPCGHVIACIQCALTLEQCAVCRQPFSTVMRVHLSMDEENVKDIKDLPCNSSQCSNEPLDPMLCKVCHKEEMAAAFIPCRHVYACVKCAADMHECPACTEGFCATIQVYL